MIQQNASKTGPRKAQNPVSAPEKIFAYLGQIFYK
jgi:hypothetical protein